MKLNTTFSALGVALAIVSAANNSFAQTSLYSLSDQYLTEESFVNEIAVNEAILSNQSSEVQYEEEQSCGCSQIPIATNYCDVCNDNLMADQVVGPSASGCRAGYRTSDIFGDSLSPAKARNWNLTVLTGYQYDSNVSASPDFVGLGAIEDKGDSAFYLASFGDFQLYTDDQVNLGIIASTYNVFQSEQTDFDLADYMVGGYYNRVLSDRVIGGVRYEFHRTDLGRSEFSNEHRLVPNISVLGDNGHMTLFYEFDNLEFADTPLITALDPDAQVNAVGVTRARYLGEAGLGRFFYGYRFESADADGSDFDRTTHQVNTRLELPIRKRLIVDGGFRYFWDDYDNPNSLDFDEEVRVDGRAETRAGVQWILSRRVSTRVDYTYINSSSNVANLFGVRFFDYQKHSLTAQLIFDF